jgi:hypothetical protein
MPTRIASPTLGTIQKGAKRTTQANDHRTWSTTPHSARNGLNQTYRRTTTRPHLRPIYAAPGTTTSAKPRRVGTAIPLKFPAMGINQDRLLRQERNAIKLHKGRTLGTTTNHHLLEARSPAVARPTWSKPLCQRKPTETEANPADPSAIRKETQTILPRRQRALCNTSRRQNPRTSQQLPAPVRSHLDHRHQSRAARTNKNEVQAHRHPALADKPTINGTTQGLLHEKKTVSNPDEAELPPRPRAQTNTILQQP